MSANFGRAVFEIRANKSQFTTETKAAETEARTISASIDGWLGKAGSTLGEGAKEGVKALDAQLDRAERRARESSSRIAEEFARFGGRLAEGLTLGGGIAAADALLALPGKVAGAFSALAGETSAYSREVQAITASLQGFTGSEIAAANALSLAQREASLGRGSFLDLATAIGQLTPSAKQSGESVGELLRLSELLGATNSAEGIRGAAYALREAASGDFTSVAERFNVSRIAIQRYRDDGVSNIEAVRRALADMGITFALVDKQANTVATLEARFAGLRSQIEARAGGSIFAAYAAGLKQLDDALSDPRVLRAADGISAGLAKIFNSGISGGGSADLERGLSALLDLFEQLGPAAAELEGAGLGAELSAIATGLAATASSVATVVSLARAFEGLNAQLGIADDNIKGLILSFSGQGGVGIVYEFARGVKALSDRLDELATKTGPLAVAARALGNVRDDATGANRGIGSAVTQRSPATAPDTDRAFDAFAASTQRAAQQAAFEDAAIYVRTFTAEMASGFQAASGVLADTLAAALGKENVKPEDLAKGYTLIAKALAEIQASGKPTAETLEAIRQAFGGNAEATIAYINQLTAVNTAQEAVTRTTRELALAQDHLAAVTKEVADSNKVAAEGVDRARDRAAANAGRAQADISREQAAIADLRDEAAGVAQAYEDRLATLEKSASVAEREAADAARARQEVIRLATADLQALQQQASAVAAEYDRQIAVANETVRRSQALASEHAEAFRAIQAGTLADFYREHEAIDESTRAIIERYNAEVAGKIAARNAASDRADLVDVEGRRRILDLTTRERAERAGGHYAEAEALAKQIALEQARIQRRSAYAHLQAQVAQDEVNAANKNIDNAAKEQAAADKKVTSEATKQVEAITTEKAARAEADKERIAAQTAYIAGLTEADRLATEQARKDAVAAQDRIAAIRDEAEAEARKFKDREAEHTKEIGRIKERATLQAAADAAALAAVQTIAGIIKRQNDQRLIDAQTLVTSAQAEATAAKDQATYQKDILTALQDRIKALQGFAAQFPGVDLNLNPLPNTPPAAQAPPSSAAGGGPKPLPPSYNPPTPTPPPPEIGPQAFRIVPVAPAALAGGIAARNVAAFVPSSAVAAAGAVPGGDTLSSFTSTTIGGRGGDVNVNAPLVDFSGMTVDSDQRAQDVITQSYSQVRRAIDELRARGPRQFTA